ELKWAEKWQKTKLYRAIDGSKKKKSYILIEFPYPSGERLHVGHARSYSCMDAVARKRRMQGENVLFPMGWDAFGLPAENYAIKTGIHPAITTAKNIANAKAQAISWGLSFDWSREINTSDPKYYKWTQWIFVQLFKHDLAYKAEIPVNWCPSCKINLANEEVIDGNCERCGTQTERRMQNQWLLRITKYADRLLADLETVDYRQDIKRQQINWIGRKEGMIITFGDIEVFTTRPDTLAGATFVAVASDDEERFTGQMVMNPATGEKIPVWKANYVLDSYGTGAVMGVPAYDERDREFALKHKIKIIEMEPDESMKKYGVSAVTYHLRDWVFSRQHYWGDPIPMIYCDKCNWQPVPEDQLPVKLPEIAKYQPTDTGESPLAKINTWVKIACPKCGGPARRETDTMPNWAGSSWYYLRYIDPKNTEKLADPGKLKYWLPVDWYNGGMEHTTLHLLYSRFWHKFLFDLGAVPTAEPYAKRTSHGVVLGPDGKRMSKSRGNVINPDEIVKKYGADTLRMYEMFMGPFEQMVVWNQATMEGTYRFLKRVWSLVTEVTKEKSSPSALARVAKLVSKIDNDLQAMKFNTVVSAAMEMINWWKENKDEMGRDMAEDVVKALAPLAPFITEELWEKLGHKDSVHVQAWPEYNPELVTDERSVIVVQVNGKVRDRIEAGPDVQQRALASDKVKKYLGGAKYRAIYVPGKIINFVCLT
ncbi:MAG: class I tRNA ligase family protein, partial [Patescibacteria group bacterium]